MTTPTYRHVSMRALSLVIAAGLLISAVGCGGSSSPSPSPSPSSNNLLASLTTSLTQPLDPIFDPAITTYAIGAALTQDTVVLTPTSQDAGASITVNTTAVTSGADSAPIALAMGVTPVTVVVTAPDGSERTYTVVIDRSLTGQEAYLKASNAEAGDGFGPSVALSGDTLVVGAYREDSSATGGEGDNSAENAGAAYVYR